MVLAKVGMVLNADAPVVELVALLLAFQSGYRKHFARVARSKLAALGLKLTLPPWLLITGIPSINWTSIPSAAWDGS